MSSALWISKTGLAAQDKAMAEAAWQRLKGTLRVQGEGVRFPAGDFQPLQVLELGLFAGLPAAYGGTRAERGTLLALVNNAVATVAGSLIDVEQRQRDLREQLTGQESAAERSWAWTFSSVLQGRSGADYARLSEAVLAQANLSRSAIVGLLG